MPKNRIFHLLVFLLSTRICAAQSENRNRNFEREAKEKREVQTRERDIILLKSREKELRERERELDNYLTREATRLKELKLEEVYDSGKRLLAIEGRTEEGTLIISRLGHPQKRADFEKELLRGVEVGLEGWQRSHSQGSGTGRESSRGILYAPSEVNQTLQNHGVERTLRDLRATLKPEIELYLKTVTKAHERTNRLREITYELIAESKSKERRLLFEATIEVENKRNNPSIRYYVR